ncbi:MAG: integrase [Leptolyngbya sp.]|nr:MAG: integrase [Leptolyngbya sp.]
MLTDSDLRIWYHQQGLNPEVQQRIDAIRHNPPARAVQGGRKNVSGRYPSKKMGVTIQFESHRVELARIIQLEFDDEVLEYYDQPHGGVELIYKARSGRPCRVVSTPDLFVIRANGASWEECKPEAELEKLAQTQPNRYCRDEDGVWRCPPGEEYAARFGLTFRVWSDVEVSWEFQDNIAWLDDYLRFDSPVIEPTTVAAVQNLVEERRGLSLADLLGADTGATPDDIYILIATRQIYVDLYSGKLSNHHAVKVFLNETIALAYVQAQLIQAPTSPDGFQRIQISIGVRLNWDGEVWEISNTGTNKTSLQQADGQMVSLNNEQLDALIDRGEITAVDQVSHHDELQAAVNDLLRQASPKAMEDAYERYQAIQPYLGESAPICPTRTVKRWRDRYRAAERKYGNGLVGLVPNRRLQGNRVPKISAEVLAYMDSYIQKHYETIKQRNAHSVFKTFKADFAEEHPDWVLPCRASFYNAVKRRSGAEQTRSRQGKRAAIQKELMYWELTRTTPQHGSRPFEIVHIDHTPMDIELLSSLESLSLCNISVDKLSKPQELANQAWLTLMIDAYSRRILAAYVTYESPSYRTCMMVMRICVSRFKRLPQTIVVDNGSEFHSIYFNNLAAFYQITLKYRPPAFARFGTLVERMFGTNNQEFLYNLQGNTQGRKNRQTTKTVDPKRNALWNLPDLYKFLCTWLYEVYDQEKHPALDQSPCDAYTSGLAIGGQREHRRIEYNENFKILTLAAPKPDTRKIQPTRGIKIFNIWYWNDIFRDPMLEKQKIEVRYDPFNIGIAYAYARNQWVKCTSGYFSVLNGRTEKEVQLASEEVKKRKKQIGKNTEISDRELAQFLKDIDKHEVLLKQRLKALDNQTVLRVIEGGLSETLPIPHDTQETQPHDSEEVRLYVLPDIEQNHSQILPTVERYLEDEAEEEFEIYGEY